MARLPQKTKVKTPRGGKSASYIRQFRRAQMAGKMETPKAMKRTRRPAKGR